MKRIIAFVLAVVCVACAFTGCSKSKTMEYGKHTVMLEATNKNTNPSNTKEDFWSGDHWTLYYDGTVKFYSELNGNEKINEDSWRVSEEDLTIIFNILEEHKHLSTDATLSDGSYWILTYTDENGSQISHFEGFVDNYEDLVRLHMMLMPMPELE